MPKFLYTILFIAFGGMMNAQEAPAMADKFREDGKIYVVIGVICTILVCLFIYMFMMDRRISRIEKTNNHSERKPS